MAIEVELINASDGDFAPLVEHKLNNGWTVAGFSSYKEEGAVHYYAIMQGTVSP